MTELLAEFYLPEDKPSLLQYEFPSPPDNHAFASSFPSPTCSNTSSLNSHTLLFDPNTLQSLPLAVLQSISTWYQEPSPTNIYFDEATNTDFFPATATFFPSTSITIPVASTETTPPPEKPKAQRPLRQLECYNCHVTKTPLWRRTPDRAHSLCNACGLYYKQYGSHRLLHTRQKQQQQSPLLTQLGKKRPAEEELLPSPSTPHVMPPAAPSMIQPKYDQAIMDDQSCSNCKQTNTPLWRKNERGESVCNACGLYARLQHRDRPPTMHKQKVQKRCWQDDTSPTDQRFEDLLNRMSPEQMQSFLVILEKRCDVLRSILYGEDPQMHQQDL